MNAAQQPATLVLALVALFSALILLVIALLFASLFVSWIRALLGGAPITVTQLIGMRLRGVPARLVVDALVALVQRGHPFDPGRSYLVESTYLAQRGLIQSASQLADVVERQHLQSPA